MDANEKRKLVKEGYGKIAQKASLSTNSSCCKSSCCTSDKARNIGYKNEDLKAIPEGADLGLGCGNPLAYSSIKEGDTVVDLGSGAGIDCFIASKKVGESGKVIGVDMTDEMLEKARENAQKGKYHNVEFRKGEIENLPIDDDSVDLIISNCVINLSPEKEKVFSEAHRVLKQGGKLSISDIVILKEIPEELKNSIDGYVGCVSGAEPKENYLNMIKEAGFKDVRIVNESVFGMDVVKSFLDRIDINISGDMDNFASSIKVEAVKA